MLLSPVQTLECKHITKGHSLKYGYTDTNGDKCDSAEKCVHVQLVLKLLFFLLSLSCPFLHLDEAGE